MHESDTPTPKRNPWIPGVKDPVLLAERVGNWQWYWLVISVTAYVLIYFFVFPYSWNVLEALSLWTKTDEAFSDYINNYDAFTSKNIYPYLMIGLFGIFQIIAGVVLLAIHRKRIFFGLSYNNVPISWAPFWKAGAAYGISILLYLVFFALFFPKLLSMQYIGEKYFALLCLVAVVLLFQTLGEEILFKGYLFRTFGAILPYRLAVVIGVSLLFTYMHTANPDFRLDPWYFFIVFLLFELVFYWLLLRTKSVMATWGVHWFNNMFAFGLLNVEPGYKNDVALFVFKDPVLSKGGTHFYDPFAYLFHIMILGLFIFLIVWKRSPFHLPKA